MASSGDKLGCLEDLLHFLEFLELTFRLLKLFFLLRDTFAQSVDLVKHDFDRGLLFPRLPCFLGS